MPHPQLRVISALFATLALLPYAQAQQQPDPAKLPYMNPALPIDQRVDDLIGRMTLEEKVSQMRDHAPTISRLNIPRYDWWNEGLHGVAFAGNATNFPQVIGMAATWDTTLVHQMVRNVRCRSGSSAPQVLVGRAAFTLAIARLSPCLRRYRALSYRSLTLSRPSIPSRGRRNWCVTMPC